MTTIIPEPSHAKREPGQLVEMAWDPITRIVGSLGIYTKIDFENREVVECHSTSSIFRGYSIFMKGKDPRDAHFITSRICGICGDNHATCSCYCQNMAYGVKPPHLGEWIVNLGEAAEYMFDHNIFQENLVGVDFCEKMVSEHRKPARMGTRRSLTSCARSTRSAASSTARHCKSAGIRGRCSASWRVGMYTRPRCIPAGSAPSRPFS
jgi:Ni,Fe-hydrogenase I large subunit